MALPVLRFIRKEITKQVSYELHALRAIKIFSKDFNWSSVLIEVQYNRGRNRKSPLTEISGLKSYERVVVYRNLSAIAELGTHFWRKIGVNWRKLWRKHRQFKDNQ